MREEAERMNPNPQKPQSSGPSPELTQYMERMAAIRAAFEVDIRLPSAGSVAIRARASAVDALVLALWSNLDDPVLASGISVVAVGGYGRCELFPSSDVDLMFLLDGRVQERTVKEPIRRLNQMLWDSGLRVSPMTRSLAECARFDAENVEFTLSLLDARPIAGDAALTARLIDTIIPKLLARDRKRILNRLLAATATRHSKYGDTLFHLEPNVKECPGGLRDAHACAWLARLSGSAPAAAAPAFAEAREFLLLVRAFLHFRHGRDDNTLDWQTQDEAAAAPLGIPGSGLDASYWMRIYFRHARSVAGRLSQSLDQASSAAPFTNLLRAEGVPPHSGFELRLRRILFTTQTNPPEHDADTVLAVFTTIARTGATLSRDAEIRIGDALPRLSATLEDGTALWDHLQAILVAPFAGRALRAMHALGILELVIPEFHGIDALVIRDAYHRYTVDEHTFVLIDTLHALTAPSSARPASKSTSESALYPPQNLLGTRFASILRDLPRPELLFLAALMHDTGKGHASSGHAQESVRLARGVLARLEIQPYEAGLVLDLISKHLEMSAALRRDVFDAETVRVFATRVPTPEALRMLTLFTYADIAAVHPDALTPWKAENLWRLHIATSNFLDRNVDDERVGEGAAPATDAVLGDVMFKVHAMLRDRRMELAHFLAGLPLRYLQTRTPDQIRAHFEMAARVSAPESSEGDQNQLDFRYAPGLSELTLVTRDRPMLFASMAGALAAWAMNIVTADAFSNAHGTVVDTFRFVDTFRTLELNESERTRFVESVRDVMSGRVDLEALLASRRRARKKSPKVRVESRISFDDSASTHSTLLQVVAQDTPGLLRALAVTMGEYGCNIEVALVDTEGEMAIDVFYVTHTSAKLEPALEGSLRQALLGAIETNAR